MVAKLDYDPKYCVEVYKYMSGGMSETQAIAALGHSRSTFYRWKKEYPEFKEALDKGKVQFDARHEELGVQGMMKTMDIDYQFWRDLGKYRNGWTEKSTGGITNNTQINIDQMNVLNEQSNDELLAYIKIQMENHPELTRIIEGEVIE
jgi:transposase-like protein